eukprot:403338295
MTSTNIESTTHLKQLRFASQTTSKTNLHSRDQAKAQPNIQVSNFFQLRKSSQFVKTETEVGSWGVNEKLSIIKHKTGVIQSNLFQDSQNAIIHQHTTKNRNSSKFQWEETGKLSLQRTVNLPKLGGKSIDKMRQYMKESHTSKNYKRYQKINDGNSNFQNISKKDSNENELPKLNLLQTRNFESRVKNSSSCLSKSVLSLKNHSYKPKQTLTEIFLCNYSQNDLMIKSINNSKSKNRFLESSNNTVMILVSKLSNKTELQSELKDGLFSKSENRDQGMGDFLKGHLIKSNHRARMIDWMIQVFRVFGSTEDQTFFLAVSILDRFFLAKQQQGQCMSKEDLHIYGLTSVFIASKLDETYPVCMSQVLEEAGHNKFSHEEVLRSEIEMFQTLQFKLLGETPTLIDQVFERLILALVQNGRAQPVQDELKDLKQCFGFVCKVLIHDYEFVCMSNEQQVETAYKVCLQFHTLLAEKCQNFIHLTPTKAQQSIFRSPTKVSFMALIQQQNNQDFESNISFTFKEDNLQIDYFLKQVISFTYTLKTNLNHLSPSTLKHQQACQSNAQSQMLPFHCKYRSQNNLHNLLRSYPHYEGIFQQIIKPSAQTPKVIKSVRRQVSKISSDMTNASSSKNSSKEITQNNSNCQ